MNPKIPESVEELPYYLNQPGFIGVKAHPFMHQYSIRALDPVAALCEEKGVPIIIHLSSKETPINICRINTLNLKSFMLMPVSLFGRNYGNMQKINQMYLLTPPAII